MKTNILKIVLFISILCNVVIAKEGSKDKYNYAAKSLDQIARTYLDINNISTGFCNNGISDNNPSGNSGLIFPKGSGKNAVYTSGLLWGGIVAGDDTPNVGGTAYRTCIQPGAILSNGHADDPSLDKYRIYRVRPDIKPGGPTVDLTSDANNEGASPNTLRAQYELDWAQWPASLGAPFTDVNGDGVYEPTIDIPGVSGADQTVWFVANDMDSGTTANLYGAPPIGIEVQVTYWAYSQVGALGDMYFRKYRIINKGFQHNTVNNMYISMWADVDLGEAEDDFVGVDSVLNLQYCYNAETIDQVYAPLPPPCTGFAILQGPLVHGNAGNDVNKNGVNDALDYGIFNGKKVGPGLINLPMTAAYYFIGGMPILGDPIQGDRRGSIEFYNFFQGKDETGAPVIDPTTGKVTTFALNGNPELLTNKGWIDGMIYPPGDRRQGSSCGPFTFAPGDTQEVVLAEIVAGAITGVDHISAIGLCKFYENQARETYNNFFNLPTIPPAPVVDKIELDKRIVLDWGEDQVIVDSIEKFSHKGYKFQGYNVYQLPSASATIDRGKRIASFDIIDGIGKIWDYYFDPNLGVVLYTVRQLGDDSGIKRSIDIRTDPLNNDAPLVNGNNYYFAVTSYSYNPTPLIAPNNLESPIQTFSVTPHFIPPGSISAGVVNNTIHTGTAEGSITVNAIDPLRIINHPYQVYFTSREEVRNDNGDWEAAGTDTTGKATRLAKYWNLKDSTTQQVKLVNQSVVNGVDLFPRRDDLITKVGTDANPIVDGMQVGVNVTYDAPIKYSRTLLYGGSDNTQLTHTSSTTTLDIQNYSIFSGTVTSKAIDNFGFGTNDINELQKDYTLKFTGIWDSLINSTGQKYHFTMAGTGSIATIFKAVNLAAHPLNPNPGTNAPFLLRIPFEVWSKDDNRQVNLMFIDRVQNETDNPFWTWNPNGRMYAIIVDSPYDDVHAIPGTPDTLNKLATWALVFYGTNYTVGDQVEIDYANPIQIGVDRFTFNPTNVNVNSSPDNFSLLQNYPNPFNPSTTIIYSVPEAGMITMKVYDILGREVRTLLNEYKSVGSYNIVFNAHGLSSGVYFYKLTAGNYNSVKKLVLLK